MLTVEDINVYYGAIHAIKGISLDVPDGEIVALIGSNGAGKSTTLRTISGLMNRRPVKSYMKVMILPVYRRIKLSAWACARFLRAVMFLLI